MSFWSKTSTTIGNDVTYVNNTYKDANGNNLLSTVTSTNSTANYRPVTTTSSDPIVQNTKYAVQNDGKITYLYTDPAGGSRQFNSLQDLANSAIPGYTSATTDRLKDSMQTNLSAAATKTNAGSPTASASPTGATGDTATSAAASGADATAESTTGGTPNPDEALVKDSRINNYKDANAGANNTLVYPESRKNPNGGDFIKFTILQYKKSGLSSPENLSAAGKSGGGVALVGMEYRERTELANIFLPIQNGIVDSMSVDWGGGELNPITAAFASFGYNVITSAGTAGDIGTYMKGIGSEMGILGNKFNNASGDLRKLLINYYTQQAVGVTGLLSRTTGAAINNNLELLFNGPMLRSFTFNFKLTPRSAKEASIIKSIIRYFKKSMVPSLSTSQLFLLAPNVFKIQYIYTGKGDKTELHPYLNKIKVAALRDFSVNYAPDGNYMTYRDGSMTQYDLSLTFGEIDPIFEQDYEKGEGLTGMGW